MIVVALSAFVLLAALMAPRYLRSERLATRVASLESGLRRWGPAVAAVVSIAVVWYVWDAVVPIPKVHDENSYLLQADIFARGRWTAPSPPLPEFFEQPHVLVVPAVASKYPPGHALLLSLGALVGFHALIPLVLTGVAAAMLFAMAGRLTNPWVALLGWIVWLSAPIVLRFQPSFFSELTTTVAVLGSWWALWEWRVSRRRRWLLLLAFAVGWGAITRPLTMLAFAIPIGVVVVRDVVRLRLWRDFGLAFAIGVTVLAVLPLWNARTTGDWRLSPIELYRRDYLPFDKVGFTPDTSPPRRGVSVVLKSTYDYFLSARKEQRLSALPRIVGERIVNLTVSLFQGARLPLLLFAIAGALLMNPSLRFALASCALLFLAHLPYAHWAPWTIYYLEAAPVIAVLTALGLWRAVERLGDRGTAPLGAACVAVVLVAFALPAVAHWRRDHHTRSALDRAFSAELAKLPPRSIVFMQYSPRIAQHMAVVFNYPNLDDVPVWVVHDLGPRNADLRRLAPDRQSFDFEEDQLARRVPR